MSKAINNPNFIATNDSPEGSAPTTGQIVDGFDFPHTGLIKVFNLACAGSYAINGFNGTNINATSATFAAGNVFLKGVFTPVTGATVTIPTTANRHHLLVARSGGLVRIQATADNEVPPFADGDVIIALLKYTGSDPMQIQYLTFNQTSKSMSVGHLNGGVYTEGLSIKSNAGDIEIEAKESDKDIIFKVNDGGTPTEVMRLNGSEGRSDFTGKALFGSVTGSFGIPERNLNLIGPDAVMRIARTSLFSPSLEFLQLSVDGNNRLSYWDIYTDADRFTIRDRQSGDINVLTILESNQNVGIGTLAPANIFQVSHTGADADNGIMIVREDTTTSEGDLLGGIGFDSTDGNVPSSVLESSAFIASIATENHTTSDKGGNLKFGVSLIDENDDTVSTIVANVGQPDTIANATTHAGLNSRATTAVVGAATYAPTIGDSGTLVIFTNASSNLTLPSINNTTSVGVQFTVFNETGSAINGQIAVSNSATINGSAASGSKVDIDSFKAATFVCSGNNTWIRIG